MSKMSVFAICVLVFSVLFAVFFWPSKDLCCEKIPSQDVVFEEKPSEAILVVDEVAAPLLGHQTLPSLSDDSVLPPDVDRMSELFSPCLPLLPIVQTISYASRVSWLSGRAAYLGDYAAHYQTSKHFISRSLYGTGHYFSDIVSKDDRFNVLRTDKKIEFHLLLDISRLRMWVYYFDKDEGQRVLLKSYPVCAGRLNPQSLSGSSTPLGTFSLGDEIAVYQPGVVGTYRNQTQEIISIFGVRWIPFGQEIKNCTGSCKGLGLHGAPWRHSPQSDQLIEYRECVGRYESNGCIGLYSEDIAELFALIVSRPSFIHIVRDFTEAKLPGNENG